ncbi:glycoside hydrolase family 2 [bacterium]|nr:MAG: glycoside hydrolase family 2 [bacterium]
MKILSACLSKPLPKLLIATLAASALFSSDAKAWAPKKAPLMTKWAADVDPKNPLPEYPRPQLVRKDWLNLNGIWQFQSGNAPDTAPVGKALSGEILVPFAVESALSGVMEHHERLWYRRSFTVPKGWKDKLVKLNFGAVDYEAEVFINGKSLGVHTGGYEQFSYDITPYLKGTGPQEIIVRVFDPTEAGGQPRGKQTTKPEGIMYTPTTGIWQTVWLEPVAKTSIQNLKLVPDIDKKVINVTVNASGKTAPSSALVVVKDGAKVIKTVTVRPGVSTAIPIAKPKLWSTKTPFLYNLEATLLNGKTPGDKVSSYFGMRKISVGMHKGVPRMLLNNQFEFQIGPLDQGFWPDGIYTAPTDAALKYDISATKMFGFNMIRKHIKVEPARWYYHADKLGMLVWQDMPSGNSYIGNPPPLDKVAFAKQMDSVIKSHWNSPSIIMRVIFNEQQGRHDTVALCKRAKSLDPSRLINRDSGGGYDQGEEGAAGDVDDVHSYPPPASPPPSSTQALACGEYGGLGFIIKGHTWKPDGWGYANVKTAKELEDTYGEFTDKLKGYRDNNGMSAAVYTEITDVEIESNGLMTYDRIIKCDPKRIALANRFDYPVPTYQEVLPTSEKVAQTWKYTFTAPTGGWTQASFDDSSWQQGPGGFGTEIPNKPKVGTRWDGSDIWLRRTFNLGNLTAEQISQIGVRDIHDEDVEVYINGVLAYQKDGFIGEYEYRPLTEAARKALILGGTNTMAVHCRQTTGGQYIDVGLSLKIPAKK